MRTQALERRADRALDRRARENASDFGLDDGTARFQAAIELGLSDGDVIAVDESGNEIPKDPRVREVMRARGVAAHAARCIVAAERGLI